MDQLIYYNYKGIRSMNVIFKYLYRIYCKEPYVFVDVTCKYRIL